jgi:hypothetical protein
MKNTWKGLMFGAFTGAAIGVILDALSAGGDRATEAGSRLKVKAHDAVDSLEGATHRAAEWVKEQDVPAKVHSTVESLASSAPVERARHLVERN